MDNTFVVSLIPRPGSFYRVAVSAKPSSITFCKLLRKKKSEKSDIFRYSSSTGIVFLLLEM